MAQAPIDIIEVPDDDDIVEPENAAAPKDPAPIRSVFTYGSPVDNLDDEEKMFSSMNAKIDKQVAEDMVAIKAYLNRADCDSFIKRIDFFEKMKDCPLNNEVDVALATRKQPKAGPDSTVQWHECAKCKFKTQYKKKLEDHMEVTHDSVSGDCWVRCLMCNFRTKKHAELRRHTKLIHPPDMKFTCDLCPKYYLLASDLVDHLRDDHGSVEEYPCEKCAFVTDNNEDLKEHVMAEHISVNVQWFKCPKCTYRAIRKINLDRHIQHKHSVKL